jgi:hypothetical protein
VILSFSDIMQDRSHPNRLLAEKGLLAFIGRQADFNVKREMRESFAPMWDLICPLLGRCPRPVIKQRLWRLTDTFPWNPDYKALLSSRPALLRMTILSLESRNIRNPSRSAAAQFLA